MTISKITIALGALIALSVFVLHRAPNHWLANTSGQLLAPVVQKIGYGRGLAQLLLGGTDLIRQNEDLRIRAEKADVSSARADALEQENVFLRDAMKLSEAGSLNAVAAGVFSYVQDAGVRNLVANQGDRAGVRVGNTVITARGTLVGRVLNVYQNHSVVQMIGDVSFEVTARVMDTDISGLVHTDARGDVILDFIQKSEAVTEGQTVLTSGNDHTPSGIIIGTVRSVETSSGALFKIVRLSPLVANDYSGNVLILKQ